MLAKAINLRYPAISTSRGNVEVLSLLDDLGGGPRLRCKCPTSCNFILTLRFLEYSDVDTYVEWSSMVRIFLVFVYTLRLFSVANYELCMSFWIILWSRFSALKSLPYFLGSKLCPVPPEVMHTVQKLVRGVVTARGVVHGTMIEYRCHAGFRNVLAPCVAHSLTCHEGQWHGTSPKCG